MDNFVAIIVYLLIGQLLRFLPKFPEETGNVLSMFVIYVSLPALVLLKIPEMVISNELLVPALTPWGMLVLSAGAVLGLSKIFGWSREITGCLLLMIPLGNTSFLGVPMVRAFFGEHAISYALLYDQLGSFLALATYGSIILALYAGGEAAPTARSVARRILTFPPFIALVLAFALRPLAYPAVVENVLDAMAQTLVPVVMIAVGFQLTLRLSREARAPLAVGLVVKLVAAPLIALAIFKALGITGEAAEVSIFEAGMPPMVSAGAVAIIARLSPPLTAALVGLGIILSFATLPALYQLM
jgi:hypothetical protein